jgi:hypothetical protein
MIVILKACIIHLIGFWKVYIIHFNDLTIASSLLNFRWLLIHWNELCKPYKSSQNNYANYTKLDLRPFKVITLF